ncbi:hypothetical protein AZJ55_01155 [Streptococcus pneumoniae]|nr:hypothetical protein AZJ55_01155 [Streptococcus pneumoniae]
MIESGGELYSMKIKEQTRKLAVGCSKHSFEVADKADVVCLKRFSKSVIVTEIDLGGNNHLDRYC